MNDASRPVIFISAGEASGDLHGAGVVRELRKLLPDAHCFGLGGDKMFDEGVDLIEHANRLSFMGFAEVVRHLPFIAKTKARVISEICEKKPDLLLLIDYPGFHFSLLRSLKKMGVIGKSEKTKRRKDENWSPRVLYYIAPQVWAWKAKRAHELADLADAIAVIFPFEVPIFEALGANVKFVGHPLLDEIEDLPARGQFLKSIGLQPDDKVVGLFPGSRKQEVRRHLPVLINAVKLLRRFEPTVKFVLAESPHVPHDLYNQLLKDEPGITRAIGVSHAVLAHANVSIVKSGSTTIEAAYYGNPFVVYYKVAPLSYHIGKRVIKVPFIAMPNLLVNERAVPELIQHDANPEQIAAQILPLLTVPAEVEQARAKLKAVRAQLGEQGAAKRVAEMARDLL